MHTPIACFNSRARKRRDLWQLTITLCMSSFNSRARKRRDRTTDRHESRSASFNSRARKRRDNTAGHGDNPRAGFNSRARKRRDPNMILDGWFELVSIHAPARGATLRRRRRVMSVRFQFTRPQEARHTRRSPPPRTQRFNSRARKRRDQYLQGDTTPSPVSIHAPARGATGIVVKLTMLGGVSIHAPARGATICTVAEVPVADVSIHAPARGATAKQAALLGSEVVSIHAPARGATARPAAAIPPGGFNSRARKRRDMEIHKVGRDLRVSIHAPARGATRT